MKSTLPEPFRLTHEEAAKRGIIPQLGSDASYGPFGVFLLNYNTYILRCICGVDQFWEHVSVSLNHRIPTWAEMCFVKDTFWDPEETVYQLHPPKSQYVNYHPFTLHLWRNIAVPFPLPPSFYVGPLSQTK
jgi:hypothetical protein